MVTENHTVRVGENFQKEIQEIKEKRIESRIDEKKKSTRVLSNLLVRHKLWPQIKEEMIVEIINDTE